MADLIYNIPQKIIYGPDTINRLGMSAASYGTHALIITEAILYERQVIQRITEILEKKQVNVIVYDEVVPNATSNSISEGITLAKGAKVDLVIGLGGVKTLSIAKCIAMAARTDHNFDDIISDPQPPSDPSLPYIEILTTCRNPFMLSDEYFIVDARDRSGVLGRAQPGITKTIIIDPKLCLSLPAKYTATTMMDTLLHAIEGFISTRSNFISDTFFKNAIKQLSSSVHTSKDNLEDLGFRTEASKAGLATAFGLAMSRPGMGTALALALNARSLVPKSWATTVLLPHVLEFQASACPEKLAEMGKILENEAEKTNTVEAASDTVETLRTLLGSLNLPSRLRDFDLNLDDMVEIAEMAHGYDFMNFLPRMAGVEDLYEILKSAF